MLKEIRTVDEAARIVRITTITERFYAKPSTNKKTGLPEFKYYPSVSWICSYYPKPSQLIKWIGERGNEEAESIKTEAGSRGSRVHQAIEMIEKAGAFPIATPVTDPHSGDGKALSIDELEALMAFIKWHAETKPVLISTEMTIFNEEHAYAGTLDRIYRIDGQIWIIDFKISGSIWTPYRLQLSAYSHADIDYRSLGITDEEWKGRQLGILQLNVKLNKAGFRFTEIEDEFNMFLNIQKIWGRENSESKPKQRDIPMVLELNEAHTIKES